MKKLLSIRSGSPHQKYISPLKLCSEPPVQNKYINVESMIFGSLCVRDGGNYIEKGRNTNNLWKSRICPDATFVSKLKSDSDRERALELTWSCSSKHQQFKIYICQTPFLWNQTACQKNGHLSLIALNVHYNGILDTPTHKILQCDTSSSKTIQ